MTTLMTRTTLASCLLAAVTWGRIASLGPEATWTGDNMVSLSQDENGDSELGLSWAIDAEAGEVVFTMWTPEEDGWLGLGVSSSGTMKGAEIQAYSGTALKSYVADDFAEPTEIQHGAAEVVEALRQDGQLRVTFKRPLKSCIRRAFDIEANSQIWVIYAYGPESSMAYHTKGIRRGALLVNLHKPQHFSRQEKLASYFDDSALTAVDVKFAAPYEVPAVRTNYMCQTVEIPTDKTYTLRGLKHNIESAFVHHTLIFSCADKDFDDVVRDNSCRKRYDPNEEMTLVGTEFTGANDVDCTVNTSEDDCTAVPDCEWAGTGPFECYEMPKDCQFPILGWAPGMSDEFWEDWSFHVGKGKVHTMVFQLHYDNPSLIEGGMDQSGMTLYLDEDLTEHEGQINFLGPNFLDLVLPPQKEVVRWYNRMRFTCPEGEARVSGIGSKVFHMHENGRAGWVKLIRDEKVFWDFHATYDFNMQTYREGDSVELKTGDEAEIMCEYTTKGKTEPVKGGWGTDEEMCFLIFYSYPDHGCWFELVDQEVVSYDRNPEPPLAPADALRLVALEDGGMSPRQSCQAGRFVERVTEVYASYPEPPPEGAAEPEGAGSGGDGGMEEMDGAALAKDPAAAGSGEGGTPAWVYVLVAAFALGLFGAAVYVALCRRAAPKSVSTDGQGRAAGESTV